MKTPKQLRAITEQALKDLGYQSDIYSLFVKRTPTMGYAIKTIIHGKRGKDYTPTPSHQARLRKELETQGLVVTATRNSFFDFGRGGMGQPGITFYVAL